jgi:hypothetical protein
MAVPEDFSFQKYTSGGGTMPSDIWHDNKKEKGIPIELQESEEIGVHEYSKENQMERDIFELERQLEASGTNREDIVYVSGSVISRENPKTGETEYLISNEAKKDGSDKPWANQPGGTVEIEKDGKGIEKHENAC